MSEEQEGEPSESVKELVMRMMKTFGEFAGALEEAREKCRQQYRVAEPEPLSRVIPVDVADRLAERDSTTNRRSAPPTRSTW